MPRLLILNHHGPSVPALLASVEETGAGFEVIEPRDVKAGVEAGFDGVIASGGFLSAQTYRQDLERYGALLEELERPYLGICLGMRILAHFYEARTRRVSPVLGMQTIHFERDYPLAPGVRECSVYQGHKYEVLFPLPAELENYPVEDGTVQAVKIKGMQRYAVQFHPELSERPARAVISNFVALCG